MASIALPPPPEWAPHEAVWIGFPSNAALWGDAFQAAQRETATFANAVHADGAGERVLLIAADEAAAGAARALVGPGVQVEVERFGDVWLRDTGVILDGAGQAHRFGFNGWGRKYEYPGDEDIGVRLAAKRAMAVAQHDWVLEGGAIDGDGTGLIVTTRQCLLHPNRNGDVDEAATEARLQRDLGCTRVLWLDEGLAADHTDGHVDNLARFVAPNLLALPEPAADDPNAHVYEAAARAARDFGVDLVRIPSPGRVVDSNGDIVPASHMNFYIGNAAVVVPLYGQESDDRAVAAIGALFPDRKTVGLRADHVLTGGGSFHCISQQIPAR
ncbi:agmatine deiminase family protein [Stakelama sp. CBK3Z-3]|uniref:Agmatine deiminase family protein n=1 Tax=Stakelama flava TaxID=2860338 RepID=A0ABS6XK91_9SPHN|nr:agmatine deiminase family protein [Stakelama flava]MBW4330620.1 agmatine deiminase family protein [Stakelama flava]